MLLPTRPSLKISNVGGLPSLRLRAYSRSVDRHCSKQSITRWFDFYTGKKLCTWVLRSRLPHREGCQTAMKCVLCEVICLMIKMHFIRKVGPFVGRTGKIVVKDFVSWKWKVVHELCLFLKDHHSQGNSTSH